MSPKYNDIKLEYHADGRIGLIKLNRPQSLNSFGGSMLVELKSALRLLNDDPRSVITVVTGEGRAFSSGADVKAQGSSAPISASSPSELREMYYTRMSPSTDLIRDMIDHKKVLVMGLNGAAVGGGAAWFMGAADLIYASESGYLQVPFGELGLVPEGGSAAMFPENMGWRRAMEFFLFGTKLDAETLEKIGMTNRTFPTATFLPDLLSHLTAVLDANEASSLLLTKKLMAGPLRAKRMHGVVESQDLLAQQFVDGVPAERFRRKAEELRRKSREKGKL